MKKTFTIALVVAMLITLTSAFASAAASSTVTITVTPPKVGDTIGNVEINAPDPYSCTLLGCFDYVTYQGNISSITSLIGDSSNIRNSKCEANQKYIALFNISSEGSAPNNVTSNVTEYGILSSTNNNGAYETYAYVVFTPTAADDSTDEDETSPNTPSSDDSSSLTGANTSASVAVTANYEEAETAATVYKVDITWGSMEFTYTETSKGRWDPSTHQYVDCVQGGWSCADGANAITVTNHSNTAVDVTFTYAAASGFANVTGSFDDQNNASYTKQLASAEGTTVNDAPFVTTQLMLSGDINSAFTDDSSFGTVTVTIK